MNPSITSSNLLDIPIRLSTLPNFIALVEYCAPFAPTRDSIIKLSKGQFY